MFDLIIERLCIADASFRPPPCDQLTYPERVSLLVLIIHIHAWRIIRDRRREEEARGMSRRRFLVVLAHIIFHTQCYFFDSDVGGFHYGPGHPYVQVLYGSESNPNTFCSVAV